MKISNKRIVSLALALAMMVGTFAACGSSEPASSATESTETSTPASDADRDSVIIATANETPSLHPYDHNAVAGDYMNQLTYDTLFVTDFELNAVPSLVESYEILSDTVWQFKLKEGIKFHDGSDLTSEDVKASLDWSKTFTQVATYTLPIGVCDIVDDYTFTMTTETPYANMLMDLTHHGNCILPSELIASGNDFNANPIGSGPYKFVEWVLGDKVVFEANENYFNGAPAIKNMTWRVIPEGSSRTIALEAGEIDAIVEVEAMDAARIDETDGLTLYTVASTSHNFMMLNNEVAPFDNELVRQAINYAVDREAIIAVALNGLGVPAVAQTPLLLPGTTEEGAINYDMDKAKELIAEWGGDPSSIVMPIICSDDTKRRAGEVIQAGLAELGINATLESMDLATYLSVTAEGDYTAALGGYTSSSFLGYVLGVCHSSGINASNKTRMNVPEVDALIDQASVTLDTEARTAICEELSVVLNKYCSQVPTYQPTMLRAHNSNLVGFECSPAGEIDYAKLSWK